MLPYRGKTIQRRRWLVCGVFIALLGAALSVLRIGDGLAKLSFDLMFLFRGRAACSNVVVLIEDRASLDALGQKEFPPTRAIQAQIVDRLREEGAKTIVFDIFFRTANPEEDSILAAAMSRHGNVVLASTSELMSREFVGQSAGPVMQIKSPPDLLRTNAAGIGLSIVGNMDTGFSVRKLVASWHDHLTLAAVAAKRSGVSGEISERWINFHGPTPSVDRVTLDDLFHLKERKLPQDFLRGKTVFIGFDPYIAPEGNERDVFATPFTRFGSGYAPGVEVLASSCANLMNNDSLRRVNCFAEAIFVVFFGVVSVVVLVKAGRRWMFPVAGCMFLLVASASFVAQFHFFVWWNWLVPATVQLPLVVIMGFMFPRLPRVAYICYRREGGANFAVMLVQAMRARGFDVFLDIDINDSHSGNLLNKIQLEIRSSPFFILVLSPGMFAERNEDWVRKEIIYAFATGRQIIPIMQDGFYFPDNMPAELEPLKRIHAITHTHLHYELTLDKLEEWLRTRRRNPLPDSSKLTAVAPQPTKIPLSTLANPTPTLESPTINPPMPVKQPQQKTFPTEPPPPSNDKDFIFISYKRDDMPRILPFLHRIVSWGYPIWYDRGIPGGAEWDSLIEEKVLNCKALVVFLSEAAVESKWVRREIKFADSENRPILGIRLDKNVELKHGLKVVMSGYQMIDASNADFSDELRKAIEYVRLL